MIETIVLENGIEYVIVDSKIIDGVKYTLFSNIDKDEDICYRKTVTIDGEKCYTRLDNEEEFKKVITHFASEYLK